MARIEKITEEEFEALENDLHPIGKSSIYRYLKYIFLTQISKYLLKTALQKLHLDLTKFNLKIKV